MSNAKNALGARFQIGDGNTSPGPEVFASISEIKDFDGPGITSGLQDASNHNTLTGFTEWVGDALTDIPEVTFDVNFLPSDGTHDHLTGLMYLALNKTKRNMKVIESAAAGGRTYAFAGVVTQFLPKRPVKGLLTASVTIKPMDYLTIS